ncbi:lipopolysaccharide biosynthesis protein [Paenibacillus polymyxa]|uniref:lipopolysaccharide biosynthesis protein n=1 Tax=Paenibacillus TaxID=44249 RepID=UPI0008855D39|nr:MULTISPECIES: oligosaccharide flippase family protein [Paenibacillus]MCL6660320.1 oligosaccharide flippase family protein [Paenibacillus amylolyticus]WJM09565.1 oligosaccharide flippase family protein [Paenibacillus sp. PK1-4R]SDD01467.1 Membrane protein involved in the export of O-antigen and teichoic acid [Paenibacillus sp. CF095]
MAQVALRKVFRGNGLMSAIFQTSGTNLLVMTLTMLSSILTSRMFGVEGKGAFSAILFWPALLTGLVGFGLPTSIIYNIKQSATEKSAQYVRLSFLFQVPVCIIIGIVAWFGLPFWLSSFPPEVVQISRWYTIATVPVLIVINLISALSQSREKFAVYNGIRLMIPLFNVGGLFVLWGLGMLSIQLAAAIYFVTSFSVVAWAIYANRNELRLRWFKDRVDQSSAKKLFGYGSKVYGVELLGTLYTQFDKIIILALLTPRDFGLYSVVFALSRIYNAVQTAISNVVFPKVTGLPQEQIIRTVGRAFRISLMVMMIIVIPTMFVGNYLMGLLFGSEFLEASVAFYILAVECIIGGGSWILASAFNALGRPGLVMIRQLIALSVTVALFFVFTPLWGLNGIAIALLIGSIVRMVVTVAAMKIVFKVKFAAMFYDKEDIPFLYERLNKKRRRVTQGGDGDAGH